MLESRIKVTQTLTKEGVASLVRLSYEVVVMKTGIEYLTPMLNDEF